MNFAKRLQALIFAIGGMLVAYPVLAHEVERSTEEVIRSTTWTVVGATSIFLVVVVLLALSEKHRTKGLKWAFFLLISVPIALTSIYLASSTVFLNFISETKGPVHWHAEFRVFNCGNELDLEDPSGLSNRIGSPLLHEHGDNWIHVEGVPVKTENVSLHHFFEDIGGELTNTSMLYPTVDSQVYVENGSICEDGSTGTLQVFLIKEENGMVVQEKLDNFADYVLSPHTTVPPGDCLIIEFGPEKERTETMCQRYEIAVQEGELTAQQ